MARQHCILRSPWSTCKSAWAGCRVSTRECRRLRPCRHSRAIRHRPGRPAIRCGLRLRFTRTPHARRTPTRHAVSLPSVRASNPAFERIFCSSRRGTSPAYSNPLHHTSRQCLVPSAMLQDCFCTGRQAAAEDGVLDDGLRVCQSNRVPPLTRRLTVCHALPGPLRPSHTPEGGVRHLQWRLPMTGLVLARQCLDSRAAGWR